SRPRAPPRLRRARRVRRDRAHRRSAARVRQRRAAAAAGRAARLHGAGLRRAPRLAGRPAGPRRDARPSPRARLLALPGARALRGATLHGRVALLPLRPLLPEPDVAPVPPVDDGHPGRGREEGGMILVVLPAYNEADALPPLLARLKKASLGHLGSPLSVIVV